MSGQPQPDTEVIVIGNGPAGLSVSAFLSGLTPYYRSYCPHPDALIHKKLTRLPFDVSLLEQDLSWYEQCFESGTSSAMGSLYDKLARPLASSGHNACSSLDWVLDPRRSVPHVVLGTTQPGGSWTTYDPQMVAVSVGGWLDLPGLSMATWLDEPATSDQRMPVSVIASYMREYAERMGIQEHMKCGVLVTKIMKEDDLWLVEGVYEDGTSFSLSARRLVLATGKMANRHMEIPGEAECSKVVYDAAGLKERIDAEEHSRVVIVGDGISAADAVLHCLSKRIPIVHVMRKSDRELRNQSSSLYRNLTPSMYPEYHKVYMLMTGRAKDPLYTRRVSATAISMDDERVQLKTLNGVVTERFSLLAACIGQRSTFTGVLSQEYTFGRDYRAEEDASLFSVGSAVGDHFVRFLVGGCMHVAQQIMAETCAAPLTVVPVAVACDDVVEPDGAVEDKDDDGSDLFDDDSVPCFVSC